MVVEGERVVALELAAVRGRIELKRTAQARPSRLGVIVHVVL